MTNCGSGHGCALHASGCDGHTWLHSTTSGWCTETMAANSTVHGIHASALHAYTGGGDGDAEKYASGVERLSHIPPSRNVTQPLYTDNMNGAPAPTATSCSSSNLSWPTIACQGSCSFSDQIGHVVMCDSRWEVMPCRQLKMSTS